jgi:hypothetical protein
VVIQLRVEVLSQLLVLIELLLIDVLFNLSLCFYIEWIFLCSFLEFLKSLLISSVLLCSFFDEFKELLKVTHHAFLNCSLKGFILIAKCDELLRILSKFLHELLCGIH